MSAECPPEVKAVWAFKVYGTNYLYLYVTFLHKPIVVLKHLPVEVLEFVIITIVISVWC